MKSAVHPRFRVYVLAGCAFIAMAGAVTSAPARKNDPNIKIAHGPGASLANDVLVTSGTQIAADDPSLLGQWSGSQAWPAVAVHSVMLHTGKVLFWSTDTLNSFSYTWDPSTEQLDSQSVGADIFCAGQSFLPDGRVLVTGGTIFGTSLGLKQTFIFDPLSQQWSRGPDMRDGRYYPTNTSLGDGRVLVFSGKTQDGIYNPMVEAFILGGGPGGSDYWDLLTARKTIRWYPRMHLLPSGRILHTEEAQTTDLFDPVAQTWSVVGSSNYGARFEGMSIMLPPGHNRIMILGGHDRNNPDPIATNSAEIIDMAAGVPAWRYTNPMNFPRMHANAVILPDGKLLVSGGTSDENITPVYPSEMFDPLTETWTTLASMSTQAKRGYHSSALLLPDARVLWAGSNGNSSAEVYSPPYLFRGARPVISSVPSVVLYGQRFTVFTPDAANITSVVFMRPGSSTHSTNTEQRYVPLTFTQPGSGALDVTAPVEPNIAQPGYYMMYVLYANGVPSVAKFVLLANTMPSNQAPIVNAGLNQSIGAPGSAVLHGTASDDGLPSGSLTTTWSVDSGPGTVTFADPNALDTTAAFVVGGTYVLRLSADDGELTSSDTLIVTAQAAAYEIRLNSSSDDAEESATGTVSLTGSDLELVYDGSNQTVGLRFNGVPVSRGAVIEHAWVQFDADEKQSEPTTLSVQGQAVDNAPTFTRTTGNISTRARTTAGVLWSPAAWLSVGAAGPDQRTTDIAPVVQEIVNRPGWSSGNSLVLIITGSGHRTAVSYDFSPPVAAALNVELADPPTNLAPTVSAGLDQTIRLPACAILHGTASDDGLPYPPGRITTTWSLAEGPGGSVEFADGHALNTSASFSTSGQYLLQLMATDGELNSLGGLQVTVNDPSGPLPLDIRVSAGSDDAEEKASGSVSLTSSDLELVYDSSLQTVGMRFNGLPIPRGSTILSAYVQFKAKEVQSEPTQLTIQGQASDQVLTFISSSRNVSSRPRTAAAVSWSPAPWTVVGQVGPLQRTPDLAAIIQEIVNRPGWSCGNSVALIITGTGHRTARSYEGNALGAPLLHVDFQ